MLNGPELCIEDIIQKIKTYQPDAVSEQVQEAYEFAKEAHAGIAPIRRSNSPDGRF